KLVRVQYAKQQVIADISLTDVLGIITFIISGFFLMMIFYSLANYRQAYRPEFLYYGGYTFCVAILLFLKAILTSNSSWFNFIFEGYLDFLIQLTSVFLYLLFIRNYLNTKINYPFLEKVLIFSQWVVIGATVLYTYIYFITDNFILQNNLELYTKFYLVVLGVIFIITGSRYTDKLLKYLVYGNINLIFFGLISLFFIATPFRFKNVHWVFNNSLLYYDISVLGECLLFLIGLSYKNRKELIEKVKMQEAIKLEKERQEMEKQFTIIHTQQEERNRISADMHDELGAGMTAIRLMSEMAKTKTKENPIPEIEKISDSSNDLLNKMNAIIWSMNSSNDTLPNLVSYIRSYALTYFENFDIKCRIDINENVPEKVLNGEIRRNIFLTVKEALNNVVKHSQATELILNFSFEKSICVKIHDNGIGLDPQHTREFGNGLKNMRKRMERLGGQFIIENNNGTTITLCIPFESNTYPSNSGL
ncbi:MAG: ATP-binding protein, partial [Sphingobacteriales bacterium]